MKSLDEQIKSGGFHEAWLIPVEGTFAFLMLSIGLTAGAWTVVTIMGTMFVGLMVLASGPTKRSVIATPRHDVPAWNESMMEAINDDQPVPQLTDFAIVPSEPVADIVEIDEPSVHPLRAEVTGVSTLLALQTVSA